MVGWIDRLLPFLLLISLSLSGLAAAPSADRHFAAADAATTTEPAGATEASGDGDPAGGSDAAFDPHTFRLAAFGQEQAFNGDFLLAFEPFSAPEDRESCLLGADLPQYVEAGFMARLDIVLADGRSESSVFIPDPSFRADIAAALDAYSRLSSAGTDPADRQKNGSSGESRFILIAETSGQTLWEQQIEGSLGKREATWLRGVAALVGDYLQAQGRRPQLLDELLASAGEP